MYVQLCHRLVVLDHADVLGVFLSLCVCAYVEPVLTSLFLDFSIFSTSRRAVSRLYLDVCSRSDMNVFELG